MSFHKSAWWTVVSELDNTLLGIPWYLDVYMLYYHKDLLEKAGVDDASAFTSLNALAETVSKLQMAGYEIPIALPTRLSSYTGLHNLSGWVWSYGGDFISADGRTLLLNDPKTRLGLNAYFSLYKSLHPLAQMLSYDDCYNAFAQKRAVIMFGNTSYRSVAQNTQGLKLGMVPIPEISFVGGSNLVMWKHIPPEVEQNALTLLAYLSSADVQYDFYTKHGILPARLDALEKIRKETEYASVVQAVLAGRTFRKFRLWGLMEEKLRLAIGQICEAISSQENPDIDAEISRVFDPLQRRLQLAIDQ